MAVSGQPKAEWERVVAIDVEIVRLSQHVAEADDFAAALDRIQIDRLLEERYTLTEGGDGR